MPTNGPLVPLSKHFDTNDALLGLFATTFEKGDMSLAYAVGTKFVEVAVYRIPQHDYYYRGGVPQHTHNCSSSNSGICEETAITNLYERRTKSAADAMWVTGLLGGRMITATETQDTLVTGGDVNDYDGRLVVDERIETLRRLAVEAQRTFEEAFEDEQQQLLLFQQKEGRRSEEEGDADEDVRRSRHRRRLLAQQHRGATIHDNDDRGAKDDNLGMWRKYSMEKGGLDRCCSDGVFLEGLPDTICTFWNTVGRAATAASSAATADEDDVDVSNKMCVCNGRLPWDAPMEEEGARSPRKRPKMGKIDVASLPDPPAPIEIPQVFIRREESGSTITVGGRTLSSSTSCHAERGGSKNGNGNEKVEDGNVSYMVEEFVTRDHRDCTCHLDVIDPSRRVVVSSRSSDVGDVDHCRTKTSYDEALDNDKRTAMDVDSHSIMTELCPTLTNLATVVDSTAIPIVQDCTKLEATTKSSSAMARARQILQRHRANDSNKQQILPWHRSVHSSSFDKDALQMALSLSMQGRMSNDDNVNVVSSSSSEVTLGSKTGSSGNNFDSVASMTLLYREQYLALRAHTKFHVRFLDTYQGRNPSTINGCTVIAPLTCVQYFTSSEENVDDVPWRNGIPDNLINHVIDEYAASILPDVRRKLRLEQDAFIIPSDVHDHFIEVGLLSTSQFVGVCGGNILDDVHLFAFKSALLLMNDEKERERLRGRKIAATFFFHGHVVALHVVREKGREGDAWVELIDSLPDPRTWVVTSQLTPRWGNQGEPTNDEWECACKLEYDHDDDNDILPMTAVRVRCTDVEHFDTLIRHYACSKFSEEERYFIDTTAWEDNNSYCEYSFDPRVFQAFIWAESK